MLEKRKKNALFLQRKEDWMNKSLNGMENKGWEPSYSFPNSQVVALIGPPCTVHLWARHHAMLCQALSSLTLLKPHEGQTIYNFHSSDEQIEA